MTTITDAARALGRLGGYATAARHDPIEYTSAARAAFRAKFRTEAARRRFYVRIARLSHEARRRNRRPT